MADPQVSQAVLLAIGTWRSDVPRIDITQLQETFGRYRARILGRQVEALARELLSDEDLADPVEEFAAAHPELSGEAVAALEWWFTANFRGVDYDLDLSTGHLA